jgi:hypothetical protein
MSERARPNPDAEEPSSIADVMDVPLDVVLFSDDSVLDHSVRRRLAEIEGECESYAAHSSSTY